MEFSVLFRTSAEVGDGGYTSAGMESAYSTAPQPTELNKLWSLFYEFCDFFCPFKIAVVRRPELSFVAPR